MTRGQRVKACLVPLALWVTLQLCLVVGFAAAQTAPEPVELDIFQGSDSLWALEREPETSRVIARLDSGTEVVLEIDYDGTADDDRFVGITPVLDGKRLEGAFWGSTAPLIYPQLDPEDHATERVEVQAEAGALRVRFEGGTYRILDSTGPDEPLFMEAIFRRRGDRLEVLLYGLYYLLPSQAGTRLEITTAGQVVARTVEPGEDRETTLVLDGATAIGEVRDQASRHLEYFDRVTRVEIDDTRFGRMEIDTWAERLQLQVNRQAGVSIELFELDFDHTYKDRGQRRVMSRLSVELP
jgi:hypothetical protein